MTLQSCNILVTYILYNYNFVWVGNYN